MGKVNKTQAAGSATDNDALSLHTTPDNYDYDDLPTYTDSEAAAASSSARPILDPPTLTRHGYPTDNYAPLPVASRPFVKVAGRVQANETTARMDAKLNDPYNLYAYIMDVVRMVPPKPMIQIVGQHTETTHDSKGSKSKNTVTDFNLFLNLQPLLRPALEAEWWTESLVLPMDKAYRGSFRKTRAPGVTQAVQLTDEATTDLKEWCEKFCEDKSMLKVFRVAREVHGLDTAVLEQLISSLIRSTEYRGNLSVTFPTEGKYVDIYSPHLLNEWRNSWVRFIFYFSMLWIITWPILFFMTKWYAPYKTSWNFSIPTSDQSNARRFAAMSEKAWFERHKQYIKHLVLDRTQGEADTDPAVVESYNNRPEPNRVNSGDANLDTAIGVISGGFNVWNQIRNHHVPSAGAWGYDT